jgi:hypothetical protein
MASLPMDVKVDRYEEFKEFDTQCRRDGILFCKLFFVTNRDAIAATLGKRLAQKKIARDLHTWLDASHDGDLYREGLAEIDLHIDPTDFIAFNSYHKNLDNFGEFVRHTDEPIKGSWTNPWIVVNTGNRHPARISLMKAFDMQLKSFTVNTSAFPEVMQEMAAFFGVGLSDRSMLRRGDTMEERMDETFKKALSLRACVLLMVLIFMAYYYCSNTYDIFGEMQ